MGERGKHPQSQCLAWVLTLFFGRVNSETGFSLHVLGSSIPSAVPIPRGKQAALPREAGRVRRAGRGEHDGSLTRTR